MLGLLSWLRVQFRMVKINRALPSQTLLPNQEGEDIKSVSAKYANDGDFKTSVQPDFCVEVSPYKAYPAQRQPQNPNSHEYNLTPCSGSKQKEDVLFLPCSYCKVLYNFNVSFHLAFFPCYHMEKQHGKLSVHNNGSIRSTSIYISAILFI